ncbi:MAG: EAL domain-containing protein [Halothece sp.]
MASNSLCFPRFLGGGVAALIVVTLHLLGSWNPVEKLAYHSLYQLRGMQAWDERVGIIAIDEKSLETLGQYPWSRENYAELLKVLTPAQPSVIVLNLLMTESYPQDSLIVTAMKQSPPVILAQGWDNQGGEIQPNYWLRQEAIAQGHIHYNDDRDGVAHTVDLNMNGALALGLVTAQVYQQTNSLPPKPLPFSSTLLINWPASKDKIPIYSFADVIERKVPASVFQNKIILIGTTAAGFDSISTPFDRESSANGVHLQAAVISNLLQDNGLQSLIPGQEKSLGLVILILLIGPGYSFIITRLSFKEAIFTGIVVCTSWIAASIVLFKLNYLLPITPPIVLFALTTIAVNYYEPLRIKMKLHEREQQLLEREFYDPLTGLPNRDFFIDRLQDAINQKLKAPDQDFLFAVLFLDLDRFKVINDSLGHTIGDELLVAAAGRLQQSLRGGGIVSNSNPALKIERDSFILARFGGDEFTILLPNIRTVDDARSIAKRIHEGLAKPFYLNGYEVYTNTSIGIAISQEVSSESSLIYQTSESILRDANIAMYQAKFQGKGRYAIFNTNLHQSAIALLELETDLRRAIMAISYGPEFQIPSLPYVSSPLPIPPQKSYFPIPRKENKNNSQFCLFYQPIISLKTGRIEGFESLIRWKHPKRGLVSPVEFIPLAEETGLIIDLGRWILQEACSQMRRWLNHFPSAASTTIVVNLSPIQLKQLELLETIKFVLKETQLNSRYLKLEITESGLMENSDTALSLLQEFQQLGIKLSLDDFGMGYSSLGRLHCLPFNTLKIDQSFVMRMGIENESLEIIETIINLAHNLGMNVVGEGVETIEHLKQLKALNCDYGQGYFFAKPLDAEAATALLANNPSWE